MASLYFWSTIFKDAVELMGAIIKSRLEFHKTILISMLKFLLADSRKEDHVGKMVMVVVVVVKVKVILIVIVVHGTSSVSDIVSDIDSGSGRDW